MSNEHVKNHLSVELGAAYTKLMIVSLENGHAIVKREWQLHGRFAVLRLSIRRFPADTP
jgi:hypothetical protein